MMENDTTLTAPELGAWLTRMAQQLDRGLDGAERERVLAELRSDAAGSRAPLSVLAQLALVEDALRVVHIATTTDGVIDDGELRRAAPLATVAARKFFQVLPHYDGFGELEPSPSDVRGFLDAHRTDARPFGGAHAASWRAVRLCRDLAARSGVTTIHELERMLIRIMEEILVGRKTDAEEQARRQLRALFEPVVTTVGDPRTAAFCRADSPDVFSGVAYGSQIFERDPFDVESIHADARIAFREQVEHAITPVRHQLGHGRSLLLLGDGGSGKTHLMRAFRAHVHGGRLGYCGYMQMTSSVTDYARYVLQNLIASLEQPYDTPSLTESGLMYLADGLAEYEGVLPRAELDALRDDELDPSTLSGRVGSLVDRLMRVDALHTVDSDLVQALLLLQRRDPAVQRRVVKFLRCDGLTSHEQALLGGLSPRTQAEDAARTIEQLARLAFHLQQAATVLLVDQIEDAIPDSQETAQIQRAVDVLRKIADAVPSVVVVISCLEDVWTARVRPRLTQSVIDRIEREPPPVRLAHERRPDEIAAMLTSRLEVLYDATGVEWQEDEPLYPFTANQIATLSNKRARDCLAFFHRHHTECVRAGRLIDAAMDPTPIAAPVSPPTAADLDRAWSDARVQPIAIPDDEPAILRTVARAIEHSRIELRGAYRCELDERSRPRLAITGLAPGIPSRLAEVCDRPTQGGYLGTQLDTLRRETPPNHVPVALRTSEFAFGPKTKTAQQKAELVRAGGLAITINDAELRAVVAMDQFLAAHSAHPGLAAWREDRRPIAQLAVVRTLLGTDAAAASAAPTAPPLRQPASDPPVAPPTRPRAAPPTIPSNQLALGVALAMRADPVCVSIDQLKTHAAFLGTTGSGKTTIALNVVEQLLERGVSAILVDRKGDLARYASDEWWNEVPADPDAARRKAALRDRIDVALYTPGDPNGRPLRLPVIPAGMAQMSTQERDQVAKVAASGLTAMMGYGRGQTFKHKDSILKKAIELHAEFGGTTLDDLRSTISKPDPALLAAVQSLGRLFGSLAEDLDSLAIQRGALLTGDGEVLDVSAMLARDGDRPKLVIISTAALADVPVLEFWVSRLLVELARYVRARPNPELQVVAFFDEADAYVPATRSPPTKDPMFDLLRRARSGGLGVLLASQNPGDFDYNARNNINTWLVGRVTQDRGIEKMRNLLADYPNVNARIAKQANYHFFMLLPGEVREIRADPSMMQTRPLNEQEIAILARRSRRGD